MTKKVGRIRIKLTDIFRKLKSLLKSLNKKINLDGIELDKFAEI